MPLESTITLGVMDDLRQGMKTPTGLGVRAVVTPVEGDQHSVGARMIADLLAMDGWEVDFLGTGTPASDLGEFVSHRNVDLVAISSTVPEFLPNVRAATDVIRGGESPRPRTMLGGGALGSASPDRETLGCDAIAGNALEVPMVDLLALPSPGSQLRHK